MSDEVGALIDIPSTVGSVPSKDDASVTKRIIGSNVFVPRENMEVKPFLKEGLVEDWDVFEDVVAYMINYLIPYERTQHPVLFSEPAWNPKLKREKMTEILFEKFECGKLLREEVKMELVPYYRVAAKEVVKDREPARFTERKLPPLTESYKAFMEHNLIQDFAATVLQVSDDRYDQNQMDTFPMISYEFPNGYNVELAHERFQLPEAMFDPSILPVRSDCTFTLQECGGNSMLSMSHIVASSISLCDIDIRPSMRLKVNFPSSLPERRFSSWVGGSILGSLGTFQQMWISRHEYEESGRSMSILHLDSTSERRSP
ncbi:Actin-like 6A [Sparganum proliferum]